MSDGFAVECCLEDGVAEVEDFWFEWCDGVGSFLHAAEDFDDLGQVFVGEDGHDFGVFFHFFEELSFLGFDVGVVVELVEFLSAVFADGYDAFVFEVVEEGVDAAVAWFPSCTVFDFFDDAVAGGWSFAEDFEREESELTDHGGWKSFTI